MKHPLVQDFQLLSVVSLILFFIDYQIGLIGFGLLLIVVWDGFFWTTVLSLPLAILIPFFCLYLWFNPAELVYMEANSFWRTIKRWVDSTSMQVWIFGFFMGLDLYNDKYFPILLMIYWLNLPANVFVYGIWTIILWPLSLVFVYLTSTYYLDFYNTVVNYII